MKYRAAHKSKASLNYGIYNEFGDCVANIPVAHEREANAKYEMAQLFAAAPDLLAFVRKVKNSWGNCRTTIEMADALDELNQEAGDLLARLGEQE